MIRVVTSSESSARDAAAIAAGIPSRALMQRAGAAAASEIALRYRDRLAQGVLVLAGPGNNGGDAWVLARALAVAGVSVRVIEPIAARSPDAVAERDLARAQLPHGDETPSDASIIVDGFFGTGGRGELKEPFTKYWHRARDARARGSVVVALDIPSGIDASTGESGTDAFAADLTLTFGTIKRGHLVRRDACGDIIVLDIGLGTHVELKDNAPRLVVDAFAAQHLPRIGAEAHKGTRKKLAIVGGARGMAGASILAARGALRSGAGMVKLVVHDASLAVIQDAEPHALAATWPADDASAEPSVLHWADALVIGPGLGLGDESRAVLYRMLRLWKGPTLIDADAITLFENRADDLGRLLGGRPALLTPHAVEFARLSGLKPADVLANRFDVGRELAARLGATILLKGVPTVITSPNAECLVSATGTPALATGGSGDVLSGVAGTLLAQTDDPLLAGAIGAYVHGRAAERVPNRDAVRGIALEDVVAELRESWTFDLRPARYPVLAELPAVGQ